MDNLFRVTVSKDGRTETKDYTEADYNSNVIPYLESNYTSDQYNVSMLSGADEDNLDDSQQYLVTAVNDGGTQEQIYNGADLKAKIGIIKERFPGQYNVRRIVGAIAGRKAQEPATPADGDWSGRLKAKASGIAEAVGAVMERTADKAGRVDVADVLANQDALERFGDTAVSNVYKMVDTEDESPEALQLMTAKELQEMQKARAERRANERELKDIYVQLAEIDDVDKADAERWNAIIMDKNGDGVIDEEEAARFAATSSKRHQRKAELSRRLRENPLYKQDREEKSGIAEEIIKEAGPVVKAHANLYGPKPLGYHNYDEDEDRRKIEGRDTDALMAAELFAENTKKVLNAPDDAGNGFLAFLQGAGDTFSDVDLWSFGLSSIASNLKTRKVFDKIAEKVNGAFGDERLKAYAEAGDFDKILSPDEVTLIRSFVNLSHAQALRAYNTRGLYDSGKIAAESIPFMAQFLATGGVGGAAGAPVKKLADWLVGKAVSNVVGKGSQLAAKGAIRLVQAAVQPLAHALPMTLMQTGMADSYAEKLVERNEDGALAYDYTSAVAPAFRDAFKEVWSEQALSPLLGVAGKTFSKGVEHMAGGKGVGKYLATRLDDVTKFLNNREALGILADAGFDGFLEEIGEEYLGALAESVWRPGAFTDMLNWQEFGKMAAGFAPMSVLGAGSSMANYAGRVRKYNKSLPYIQELLAKEVDEGRMTEDEMSALLNRRTATLAEIGHKVSNIITPIVANQQLSSDQLGMLWDFAVATGEKEIADACIGRVTADRRAEAARALQIEMGGRNYVSVHDGERTVSYVEKDGARRYVLTDRADADGKYLSFDANGEDPLFIRPEDYGEMNTMSEDAFLDSEYEASRQRHEQQRMAAETEEGRRAINAKTQAGRSVLTLKDAAGHDSHYLFQGWHGGEAVVSPSDEQGRPVVNKETKQPVTQRRTMQEIADALGMNVSVLTDAQLEQRRMDEAEAAQSVCRMGNTQKGAAIEIGGVRGRLSRFWVRHNEDGSLSYMANVALRDGNYNVEVEKSDIEDLIDQRKMMVDAQRQDRKTVRKWERNDKLQSDQEYSRAKERYTDPDGSVRKGQFLANDPENYARYSDETYGRADTDATLKANQTAAAQALLDLQQRLDSEASPEAKDALRPQVQQAKEKLDALNALLVKRRHDASSNGALSREHARDEVDALIQKGLSEEEVTSLANKGIEQARQAIAAIPVPEVSTDVEGYLKQKEEYNSLVANEQAKIDYWESILNAPARETLDAENEVKAIRQRGFELLAKISATHDIDAREQLEREYDSLMIRHAQASSLADKELGQIVAMLNEHFKSADLPTHVVTLANILDYVKARGISEQGYDNILRMLALQHGQTFLTGKIHETSGFTYNGEVYIIADVNRTAEVADVTYMHERQHIINRSDNTLIDRIVSIFGDKASLLDALDKIHGLAGYESYSAHIIADEIAAYVMEQVLTGQDYVSKLEQAGFDKEFINIFAYEQQRQQQPGFSVNQVRQRDALFRTDAGRNGEADFADSARATATQPDGHLSRDTDEGTRLGGIAQDYSIMTEGGMPPASDVERARQQVDPAPSDAQKEAGNYRKGHIRLDGFDITLENPKGSVRSGVDRNGREWHTEMHNDYGYFRGTQSVDGDHIDVFLSDSPREGRVYVVDQIDPESGEFDEHKVMYGFGSLEEARSAYLSNYEPGWQGLGRITEASKEDFRKWIESSRRKTKPFSEYKNIVVAMPDDMESYSPEEINSEVATFRTVTDQDLIRKLESGPVQEVYRAMQVIDGKLYPPMSAYINGELREPSAIGSWEMSEEHPELADDNGYFLLEKGRSDDGKRKSLKAAYNPYYHTALNPINDQFSEAQNRSNMVIVRGYVPMSEIEQPYHAEKAKDSTGKIKWHKGPIAGVLGQYEGKGREVILSRYFKLDGIVPESEIAEVADGLFKDTPLERNPLPTNVFTPALRAELEKLGYSFVDTDNTGKLVSNPDVTWASIYGKKALGKKGNPKATKLTKDQRWALEFIGVNPDEFEPKEIVSSATRGMDRKSRIAGTPIQGLESYTRDELNDLVWEHTSEILSENGIEAELVDVELHGSRARGTARIDSDLDAVIEYRGDIREDDMFNILNDEENKLVIDGISVDINPIRAKETGTMRAYMERSRRYDAEVTGQPMFRVTEITPEVRKEMDDIISEAKKNGTYLKAPNGKNTKLSPEQWAMVRTKRFKKWFGDWELAARILNIVSADPHHGFRNFAEAKTWAKENIVRTLSNEETGGKGEIRISNNAVSKFLSESAISKSESKDVHLSVLKVLPDVIRESIDAEQHPDYLKGEDGKRSAENGVNEDVIIHRLYGAIDIDGEKYRVKVTLKEDSRNNTLAKKAYSYEATKIELLAGTLGKLESDAPNTNNSISVANLLNGVEKSYSPREKIINSSKVVDENGEPRVVYHGTTNDETRQVWDENTRSYDTLHSPFTVFKRRVDGLKNAGFFFNSDSQNAYDYGYNTYDVFLNIKNPLLIDAKGSDYTRIEYNNAVKDTYEWGAFAEQNGYDGVIIKNVRDGVDFSAMETPTTDYIAFKSAQIKSATDNNGEFSSNNPDIRFSVKQGNLTEDQRQALEFIGVNPDEVNSQNERARFSITPAQDAEYLAAVESGDMEKAQQMVRDAFRGAYPDTAVVDADGGPKRVLHGTPNEFTVFDKKKAGSSTDPGWLGTGFYFYGNNPEYASQYAKGGRVISAYLDIQNPYFATSEEMNRLADANSKEVSDAFRKMLEDEGYDGVFYNEDLNEEWVAFEPSQIKSADAVAYDDNGNVIPLSKRFNSASNDIRFRAVPVEGSKDLVAVHNLNEQDLRNAFELGGFPMPSIAVTKADVGHTTFGDISLVFDKKSIDPKNRMNKVYGGDAWTPMFPKIGYKLNADKAWNIYGRAANIGPLPMFEPTNFHRVNYEDNIDGLGSDSVIKYFRDDYGTKQFFLAEQGNPVTEYKTSTVERYNDRDVARFKELIDKIGIEKLKEDRLDVSEETCNVVKDFTKFGKNDESLKRIATLYAMRAVDYVENGNRKEETDLAATRREIDSRIDQAAYEKWLEDLFSGIVEKKGIRNERDAFTPSGNRRAWESLYDEITLDNVVRAMSKAPERGGTGFFGGNIFGASARSFNSIDEIRSAARQLIESIDPDEMTQRRQEILDRLSAVKVTDKAEGFGEMLDLAKNIQDAVAQSHTPEGIYRYLKEFYPDTTMEAAKEIADIVKDIQQLSTRYFEAKPYRAVGFEEVKLAIVPEGTSQDVVNGLEERGVDIRTYEDGNQEQRKEILSRATEDLGLRFSIIGKKGAAALDKAEEASIRIDNLAVAREMEKSGKDALSIKMATGWERGADRKWRYEILDGRKNTLLSDTEDVAREDQIFLYDALGQTSAESSLIDNVEEKRQKLLSTTPTEVAPKQIVGKKGVSGERALDKALKWYADSIGKALIFNTEIGDVVFDDQSIRSSLAHKYGQAKLDALISIPDGFKSAVYLTSMNDLDGGMIENSYFAYPIQYEGERMYVLCRSRKKADAGSKRRIYIHEVLPEATIKEHTLHSAAGKNRQVRGMLLYLDLLKEVLYGKDTNSFEKSNTPGIEYRISPAQDTEYIKAYEAGNEESARRMVEQAAKDAGYNVRAFHGTDQNFTKFENRRAANGRIWGRGFYFADSEKEAEDWGRRASGSIYGGDARVIDAFLSVHNPLEVTSGDGNLVTGLPDYVIEDIQAKLDPEYDSDVIEAFESGYLEDFDNEISERVGEIIQELGYDAIQGYYYDQYHTMVFSPNQIKSADTFTFDDEGKLIPLSERFNKADDDIRFRTPEAKVSLMAKAKSKQKLADGNYPDAIELDSLRFRITYGGNSGYVGYSMSKRAAEARAEGAFPKTDFRKNYDVSTKLLDLLVSGGYVSNTEWHHTSMYGNRTTFYRWEDFAFKAFQDNREAIASVMKDKKLSDSDKQKEIGRILDASIEESKTESDNLAKSLDTLNDESNKMSQEEQEERKAYNERMNDSIPTEWTASNGAVVRDGIAYAPDGTRLSKRVGKAMRDEALAEFNATFKQNRTHFTYSREEDYRDILSRKDKLRGQIRSLQNAEVDYVNENAEPMFRAVEENEVRYRAIPNGESMAERTYRETGAFSFTGKQKIESIDDVAFIFRELQNAATENSFLVLVKDGVPIILHTGIGDIKSTHFDIAAAIAGYNDFAPDTVYMVHNHPSGALIASSADIELFDELQGIFKDTEVQGIILDTVSGNYGIFGSKDIFGRRVTEERAVPEDGGEYPVKVLAFDRQVFAKDFKSQMSSRKIGGAGDVAGFLSAHRLGEGSKLGVLLLNNHNVIMGNYVTNDNVLTEDNASLLAEQVANTAVHNLSTSVILFGNFSFEPKDLMEFRKSLNIASGNTIILLDVVQFDKDGYYRSVSEGSLNGKKKELAFGEDSGVRFSISSKLNKDSNDNLDRHKAEDEAERRFSPIVEISRKGLGNFLEGKGLSLTDFVNDAWLAYYSDKVDGSVANKIAGMLAQGMTLNEAFIAEMGLLAQATELNEDQQALVSCAAETLSLIAGENMTDNDALWAVYREFRKDRTDMLNRKYDIEVERRLGHQSSVSAAMTLAEYLQAAGEVASDIRAKHNALMALATALTDIHASMGARKEYDRMTAQDIVNLARMVITSKLFDDATNGEVKRLLGIVRRTVGMKKIDSRVNELYDLILDNSLRNVKAAYKSALKKKAVKLNKNGVVAQGSLDIEGQSLLQTYKDALVMPLEKDGSGRESIADRMAAAIEKLGSGYQKGREAEIELTALHLAERYLADVAGNEIAEQDLAKSMEDAKEALKEGRLSEAAFRQFVQACKESIRTTKTERLQALSYVTQNLLDFEKASRCAAIEFIKSQKGHIEDIHHDANSDMEGRPADEFRGKPTAGQNFLNSAAVRFVLSPLATFDQMMRMFGNKNVKGEGYLFNRFVRGWVDCSGAEFDNTRSAYEELDAKVSEVFGKKMRWSDMYSVVRRMPTMSCTFNDGGEMKAHTLTQGNLLYILLADNMEDGRMKLRAMGIDADAVDAIRRQMDPRLLELGEWVVNEFLPSRRGAYNEVHERMFGAPMSSVENYFPLHILKGARTQNVDVADANTDPSTPSTVTGHIIKRTKNALALDVLNTDAFSAVVEHIQKMEHWRAFAEWNRDLSTLLSYRRFRNQVENMSSIYGSGSELWKTFVDCCMVAAGSYKPKGDTELDRAVMRMAKGVTAAKISLRLYTALKQFLSFPAYFAEASSRHIAAGLANPIKGWNWCMDNLPLFRKRWLSRQAGDHILSTSVDWRSRAAETAARIGMTPNAFIDALTVSIGAYAIYKTRFDEYKKMGYGNEAAERKAKQDAVISYNETQQSNESAFLSPVQNDRSVATVAFTVFRNSSMGYTRQSFDASRNLIRRMGSGYRSSSVGFMRRQLERDGVEPDMAYDAASRLYARQGVREVVRKAIFDYVLPFFWNLGPFLPYLFLGDDDDEKRKMMEDAATHALFGPVEGLTGGSVMSEIGNMVVRGESLNNYDPTLLPFASDVKSLLGEFSRDHVAAINSLVNLVVQMGIGINPQTIEDMVLAVIDAAKGDPTVAQEALILGMRLLEMPQSQIEKIYLDEIQMSAVEARKLTMPELAERYARYRTSRGAALTGWMYTDAEKDEVMNRYVERFENSAKERLSPDEVDRRYAQLGEQAKALGNRVKLLRQRALQGDAEAEKELTDIFLSEDYGRALRFENEAKKVEDKVKEAVQSPSIEDMLSSLEEANALKEKLYGDFGDDGSYLLDQYVQYTKGILPQMAKLDKQYETDYVKRNPEYRQMMEQYQQDIDNAASEAKTNRDRIQELVEEKRGYRRPNNKGYLPRYAKRVKEINEEIKDLRSRGTSATAVLGKAKKKLNVGPEAYMPADILESDTFKAYLAVKDLGSLSGNTFVFKEVQELEQKIKDSDNAETRAKLSERRDALMGRLAQIVSRELNGVEDSETIIGD